MRRVRIKSIRGSKAERAAHSGQRHGSKSYPTQTLFTWVYSRIVSKPISLPMPLIFIPPNGEAGSTSLDEVIHTIPARSRAATPVARRRVLVQRPAPGPYG